MRNPAIGRRNVTALAIVATALGVMFIGDIMPTPLYPLYRQTFGFSAVTLTLIYAVYVLGNLVALLLFGRLADQIGRRSTTLPAIGVGVASALAFAFASSTSWLFVGRILSGFSTGLAAGAALAGPLAGQSVTACLLVAAGFDLCAAAAYLLIRPRRTSRPQVSPGPRRTGPTAGTTARSE